MASTRHFAEVPTEPNEETSGKSDGSQSATSILEALPSIEQLVGRVAEAERNIAAATSRAEVAVKQMLVRAFWAEKRAEIFAEELGRAREETRRCTPETLAGKAQDEPEQTAAPPEG